MKLITKLPYFYNNYVVNPIQDALSSEVDSFNTSLDDTLNQFFVDSATHGLDRWEKMLGIPKNTFDYQTRRENIKAKMRSRGTTTIAVIKNVCEAYSNAEVDVIVDHANYSFIIDFVGSIGIPKAFEELDRTIEEIKPAHLSHSYKINYNTHNDIINYTHEYLSRYTHSGIRNSEDLRGDINAKLYKKFKTRKTPSK